MKEAYITQLTEVEKALEENNGAFSDAIIERLSALVTEMKGMRISAEEYLKVMQLFFRKYEKERNREGQHYCAIRMLQLQRYLKSRSSKQTVHKEFPDQMAKRTVINRACKMFFNTSDDSDLLIDSFNATGDVYDNEENIPDVVEKPADSRLQALNDIAAKATLPEPKNTVQEPAEEGMSLESIINEGEKEENEQLYLDR